MSEPPYPGYGAPAGQGTTSTDERAFDPAVDFAPPPPPDQPIGAHEAPESDEQGQYSSTDWSTPAHTSGLPPSDYQPDAYPPGPYSNDSYPQQDGAFATGVAFGAPPAPGSAGPDTSGLGPPDGMSGATTITAPPPGAPPVPAPGEAPTVPPTAARGRARGPRRARLQLRHIDPWTVLKFSCVLSIALFFVWLITIGVLYGVLQAAGVIGKINDTVTTINGSGSTQPVTPGIVFGGAAIIGVVNIVLFIALSTVGSVVYNLCADLVGGVEVTLSERD